MNEYEDSSTLGRRRVLPTTGMRGWRRLPMRLPSARGGIITGSGLLIAILVTVAAGSDLTIWFAVTAGAAGTVLGLAAALLIATTILRQPSSPESAALAVAGGDLAAPAPITGPRGLAQLGASLNRMTDSLLDASKRRVLDGTLQRSEEYSRSLIEHASGIITILDGDGAIRYANPSFRRALGYKPEELIGKDAFGFVHPDDMPAAIVNFSLLLLDPGTPRSVMYRLRRADGSWHTLEAMGSNVIVDSKLAIIINSRDITERGCAEEAE